MPHTGSIAMSLPSSRARSKPQTAVRVLTSAEGIRYPGFNQRRSALMRKPSIVASSILALALLISGVALAEEMKHDHGAATAATQGSWKGEIVDIACQAGKMEAKGAGHADCAKKCLKNGQPMGLLTADGDMYLLVADHANDKPFQSAKDMAGSQVEVTGQMAERGGMKVVSVAAVKPAA